MAQAGNKHGELSPLALFAFFVNRCKENLHVVVAFSPIGDAFRNRLRQFPSLINCCTIDWFQVCNLQCVCVCVCVCVNCSVISDSLQPHGWYPTRLLCPCDSPGKNTGVGCHSLLKRLFPTQESNLGVAALQADSLPSGPSEIIKSFGLLQKSYSTSINMHVSSAFWLLTLTAAPGTWKTP